MRRRKDKHHSNHERWLISYADFITLLFAFFVVMYATSKADQKKQGRLQPLLIRHSGHWDSFNQQVPQKMFQSILPRLPCRKTLQ
jgi:flagellar motor protein MotB